MTFIENLGNNCILIFKNTLLQIELFLSVFQDIFKLKKSGFRETINVIIKQIYFTGVAALSLVSVLAIIFGGMVIFNTVTALPQIGAESFLGEVLVIVIIKGIGPLLTSLIVIGRSGTAIAVELATMKVTNELEALEIMGVDIIRYIVTPRFFGVIISLLGLILWFDIVAIFGGYFVSNLKINVSLTLLLNNIIHTISIADIFLTVIKSIVFGAVISIISVFYGLSVDHSYNEIPRAATRTVIRTLIYLFLFNILISYFEALYFFNL